MGTPSSEQTEPDEAPIEEEPVTPAKENSWDGWKILLAKLGLDFDLPQPPTDDPNYVPVPPTATIEEISAEGKVIVKFSKPVFELQDMTIKTIEAGRRLAEKPFLDVFVTPGENTDPELLGMKVSTAWPDSQTIEIDVAFTMPPAVSASQPEDTLVIGLYGPFFDQE